MKDIVERLKSGLLISDGAMGTVLQQRSIPPGQAPEEWNLSHPQVIEQIHQEYIQAGAEMILTNTFGGNRLKLKKAGLEDKIGQVNTEAVRIARKAAGDRIYVAGDIGPTGEFMEPLGSFKREDFLAAFREQAWFLAKAGVDLFVIETMTDIGELLCVIEAIRQISSLPIIACMSFEPAGDEYRTMMGVGPEDMVKQLALSGCQVQVIGANCGLVPAQMKQVMADLKARTELFLMAEPNAGHPKLEAGQTIFEQTPEKFAKDALDLVKAGVNILGGCCGTTPGHIKRLCDLLTR